MKQKPHILVIKESYWPQGGGSSLAIHLILGLLKEDFDITVLTGTPQPQKHTNVKYIFEPLLRFNNRLALWFNVSQLKHKEYFLRILKTTNIVYIPGYAYTIIPFISRNRKKIVLHFHGYEPLRNIPIYSNKKIPRISLEYIESGKLRRSILQGLILEGFTELLKNIICKSDILLCVSRRQAKLIGDDLPKNCSNKIKVIYNPLPTSSPIKKSFKEKAFVYSSGDAWRKGFDTFIQASRTIVKQNKSVKFYITGRGYRKSAYTLFSKLNVMYGNAFTFLGNVRYEELLEVHKKVRGLIMPALWEDTLPYVITESALFGTIPIASRVGGIPEQLEGTPGERFMFEPSNVEMLIEKINEVILMSDDEFREVIFKLRASIIRKFNNEKTKKLYVDTFYSLLK